MKMFRQASPVIKLGAFSVRFIVSEKASRTGEVRETIYNYFELFVCRYI